MATEFALVAPVLMLLVLGLLQFGLWYHGRQVALGAAQEGVRVVAAEGGSEKAGQRRAQEILTAGLGNLAAAPVAKASLTPERASLTVEAILPGLLPIPGLREFHLRATASSYRERFRPLDSGR